MVPKGIRAAFSAFVLHLPHDGYLEALKLVAGAENNGENLIRCYEELIQLAVVDAKEMALVKAWVSDLEDLR
jgi:hypothetical protein